MANPIFNPGFIGLIEAHAKGNRMENRNAIIEQLAYLQGALEELRKILASDSSKTSYFKAALYGVVRDIEDEESERRLLPICLAMEQARIAVNGAELRSVTEDDIREGLWEFFNQAFPYNNMPAEKIFSSLLFHIWENEGCIHDATWQAMQATFMKGYFKIDEGSCNG